MVTDGAWARGGAWRILDDGVARDVGDVRRVGRWDVLGADVGVVVLSSLVRLP